MKKLKILPKTIALFAVVLGLVVCVRIGRWHRRDEEAIANSRIQAILEKQSPDDVTREDAQELLEFARSVTNHPPLHLEEQSLRDLIRAFTFGCGEAMEPDYEVASNLVAVAAGHDPLESQAPELLFLRATILGKTAKTEKDLSDANDMLKCAAERKWIEAKAKHHQGGFRDFVSSTITEEKTTKSRESKETRTKDYLERVADRCDDAENLSDPNLLLLKYDAIRTATILGKTQADTPTNVVEQRRERVSMLLGRQGFPFLGSPKLESHRRVLVCTEEPCRLFEHQAIVKVGWEIFVDKIQKQLKKWVPDNNVDPMAYAFLPTYSSIFFDGFNRRFKGRSPVFLAMPFQDIECYNEKISKLFPDVPNKTLVFDPGHPQDKHTYIQHPHQKNRYVELTEFPFRILKEKAAELDRVLSSLGATNIVVEVLDFDSVERREARYKDFEEKLEIESGLESGDIKACQSFAKSEYDRRLSEIQLAAVRIGHPPVYHSVDEFPPDKFPFFYEPDQIEWKTLAEDVCNGKRKKASFRLSFTNDYGYDSEKIGKLEVAIREGVENGSIGIEWKIRTVIALNSYLVWECSASFE